MIRNKLIFQDRMNLSRRRPCISIERIYEAVSDLSDSLTLCTTVLPKGIPIQVVYENFILSRVYTTKGRCIEVTDLLFSHLPKMIESDYMQSVCNGDFDLTGQLWISNDSLSKFNMRITENGHTFYHDTTTLIQQFLDGSSIVPFDEMLVFTPIWSSTLMGDSIFVSYEEFLEVMGWDFKIPDYITTKVNTVDNIVSLYNRSKNTKSPSNAEQSQKPYPDTLVIHKDDISRVRGHLTSVEEIIVAEIGIPDEKNVAFVSSISIEPDRFGRIHPHMTLQIMQDKSHVMKIELPFLEDLLVRDYREKDLIDVTLVNNVICLGDIIERDHMNHSAFETVVANSCCSYCTQKLTRHNGQFYCENPTCFRQNYNRLLHMCRILNIPANEHSFIYPHFASEMTLAEFLDLNEPNLRHFLKEEYLPDVRNAIADNIFLLHDNDVVTMEKLLDALSLRGLFSRHINKIVESISSGKYSWKNLPEILTTPSLLGRIGIPPQDTFTIKRSAMLRLKEIRRFSDL